VIGSESVGEWIDLTYKYTNVNITFTIPYHVPIFRGIEIGVTGWRSVMNEKPQKVFTSCSDVLLRHFLKRFVETNSKTKELFHIRILNVGHEHIRGAVGDIKLRVFVKFYTSLITRNCVLYNCHLIKTLFHENYFYRTLHDTING